ncbi:hypothetical protein [Gracilimonas amylolytica]|uniref:hypothetical protein n=1 Tax=Gracilimonas amylolytica TaxID=1749045 RepID=UPI000CD86D62|nr:hypothetical protein [Gracilimonas amylolytica]
MDESKSDDKILYNLSLSVDRDNYFRRTCSSCGRDFKTKYDESDLAWTIAPQIQRMGLEIGDSPDTIDERENIFCPYCEHSADTSEMLSEDVSQYIKRHILREFILPMTNKMFSGLENMGTNKGGFINIETTYTRSMYPPRPIHGPEQADMKIIEFLCCNKRAKISEKWNLIDRCVFCGTKVTLV